jgi:hypothetical protein
MLVALQANPCKIIHGPDPVNSRENVEDIRFFVYPEPSAQIVPIGIIRWVLDWPALQTTKEIYFRHLRKMNAAIAPLASKISVPGSGINATRKPIPRDSYPEML